MNEENNIITNEINEPPVKLDSAVTERPIEQPQEVKEERPKKRKRRVFSRVIHFIIWIVLIAWIALVVTDYFHVKNSEKPQFCIFNEKTTNYSDGTVTECTGLGYKVINYNRASFKAVEFGPFWTQDRTANQK